MNKRTHDDNDNNNDNDDNSNEYDINNEQEWPAKESRISARRPLDARRGP